MPLRQQALSRQHVFAGGNQADAEGGGKIKKTKEGSHRKKSEEPADRPGDSRYNPVRRVDTHNGRRGRWAPKTSDRSPDFLAQVIRPNGVRACGMLAAWQPRVKFSIVHDKTLRRALLFALCALNLPSAICISFFNLRPFPPDILSCKSVLLSNFLRQPVFMGPMDSR